MGEPRTIHFVSLGCAKNRVDTEVMLGVSDQSGFHIVDDPADAEVIVVNTCGFIASAREESRAVLRELTAAKRPDQQLIAAGCYSQRCPHELAKDVPGIDGLIGTRRWMDILDLVTRLDEQRQRPGSPHPVYHVPPVPTVGQDARGVIRAAAQGASAYLKVSDGCRGSCAFCAIPLIKGPAVSRSAEAILTDARRLADSGVQEIILIGQDTTDYGYDLSRKESLAWLLGQLVEEVPDVPWIRLMYAYPGRINRYLIEAMAQYPQVLPYVDLPLQHADPDILRRMRRPANIDRVRETIRNLREAMPEIAIRTTFLVGYPGETEEAFQALLGFVREVRFDRLGVFTYSREEGTPAAELQDDVPVDVKEARRQRLLEVQQSVSLEKNRALVGETIEVLIEGQDQGLSAGRSYRDAPEVDGLVLIQQELPVGEIVEVRVVAALEYDLIAETPSSPEVAEVRGL